MNLDSLLAAALDAGNRAAVLLRGGYESSFAIDRKEGRHNLVTEYDRRSEALIKDVLLTAFPDHGFLGEEGSSVEGSEVRWIVDPLDGTVNFAHGIPIFCVSIAAVDSSDSLLCGAIIHPLSGEVFTAVRGGGAFLGSRRLAVSATDSLGDALSVTGFPYNVHENPGRCIDHVAEVLRRGMPVRRLGSAALDLAYLAAGRFDAYWEVSLQPWDVAAGRLIVEEAGGRVTNYEGGEHSLYGGTLLATNGILHGDFSRLLAQV